MRIDAQRSALLLAIILLNGLVYAMWAIPGWISPDLMAANFLVSWSALAQGRWWTALTAFFSQNMSWHFLLNMYVLWSFGAPLERFLGRAMFLRIYLLAGLVASLCHSASAAFILGDPDLPSLGASGAIAGIVVVFALTFPRARLYLFGFIPMPALVGVLAFAALDAWGLVAQARGGGLPIGHGAHLGGAMTGAVCYYAMIRPRLRGRTAQDSWA